MIHLRSRISNDLDVFREELVPVLQNDESKQLRSCEESSQTKPNKAGNCNMVTLALPSQDIGSVNAFTVFFFARSPDAPKTTMMVFSLSSIVLYMSRHVNDLAHYLIE